MTENKPKTLKELLGQAKTLRFEWHSSVYWVSEQDLVNLIGEQPVLNACRLVAERKISFPIIKVDVVSVGLVEQALSLSLRKEAALRKQIETLQKAIDGMVFWWKPEKMTVGDSGETWLVETLNPQNFNSFASAMDTFIVLFSVFKREFEGLRELLCERPSLENVEEPALRKETLKR